MNEKLNRVGLTDISELALSKSFNKVQTKILTIKKELDSISKQFKALNAQERLILFDVIEGILIDMSGVSTFLAIAILEKYKYLTLSGNKSTLESSIEANTEIVPTTYIG